MSKSDARKHSLFDDSDDESDGGVKLKINSEYAKRFEHNKKREELHRCERPPCPPRGLELLLPCLSVTDSMSSS